MDYDGSVVPIGKLMKYSTRKIINFLKLSFVFTIPKQSSRSPEVTVYFQTIR